MQHEQYQNCVAQTVQKEVVPAKRHMLISLNALKTIKQLLIVCLLKGSSLSQKGGEKHYVLI